MITSIAAVFILVYTAIAFEHPLQINKSASALIGAGVLWTIYAIGSGQPETVTGELSGSLMSTAQIVFFLIGAMTIVEVVDAHDGFYVITSRISTTKLSNLMWLVGVVTFFLSAILDNLTTTIVMVSLMKKLLDKQGDRQLFAGIIVIAANSGGAWTPIGDVTTTMLWIGGQITSFAIMKSLFWASLVSLLVPLFVSTRRLRNQHVLAPDRNASDLSYVAMPFERNVMFCLGLGIMVFVPVFKAVTGLPPFMGILLGLGIVWAVGDYLHKGKPDSDKEHLTLVRALTRIDMSSIVFFIGILLAVATLEHTHILSALSHWLEVTVGHIEIIVLLIGLVSAIVDNVPLVAASMGMYGLAQYPIDSFMWEFLAYCAGTGGSILVIGSAAGVAAMGLEKISFGWYLQKISTVALIGYVSGAAVYILQYRLTH